MPVQGMTPEQIAAETAKQVAAGIKSTSKAAKLEGETYAEANARLTAGYKAQPKPELTQEGAAAGAIIKFVRTAAGGIGTFKEIYPIGTPVPETRTTNYGNTYDAQGNLISGTGLKPGVSGTITTKAKTPEQQAAYDSAKALAESFVELYGGQLSDYFNIATGVVTRPSATVIAKKFNTTVITDPNKVVTDPNKIVTDPNKIVTDPASTTGAPTTNIDVLKAALKGMGFSSTIIESSTAFLNGLLRDGLDYDNATEIFLNSKEYTLKNGSKITSPFYTEYGYLNEGLTVPKTAETLFNTVEGFKGVVSKYKLSSKYLTQDALKAYVKNDVTVADLAERAGTAQLRALEADPFQVDALIKQGFISSAADLADFYLDPKIGKEQLELNRQTGVFTAEALRRTKSGISTSAAQLSGFKQLTATLASKGYSEAQIAQLAGTGFENIAQDLQPTTQLAQIYEKAGGTVESNAALTENIQSSLLQEEFMGTASERRKRLSEQNQRAFQGQAGTTSGSLRTSSTLGML
jgi:hypothetical protein